MLVQKGYPCSPLGRCRKGSNLRACPPAKASSRSYIYQSKSALSESSSERAEPKGLTYATCSEGESSVSRRQNLAFLAAAAILGLSPASSSAEEGLAAATPAARALNAIRHDFVDQQYYVTGELTPQLFAPDCLFKDPTVEVVGVVPYVRALQTLFDPAASRADLISIRTTASNKVELRWRLEGTLKLGGLKIKPYTGTTIYTLSRDGKVVRHEETWDISTVDAFVSTFVPGFGAPPAPPVTLPATAAEEQRTPDSAHVSVSGWLS